MSNSPQDCLLAGVFEVCKHCLEYDGELVIVFAHGNAKMSLKAVDDQNQPMLSLNEVLNVQKEDHFSIFIHIKNRKQYDFRSSSLYHISAAKHNASKPTNIQGVSDHRRFNRAYPLYH